MARIAVSTTKTHPNDMNFCTSACTSISQSGAAGSSESPLGEYHKIAHPFLEYLSNSFLY